MYLKVGRACSTIIFPHIIYLWCVVGDISLASSRSKNENEDEYEFCLLCVSPHAWLFVTCNAGGKLVGDRSATARRQRNFEEKLLNARFTNVSFVLPTHQKSSRRLLREVCHPYTAFERLSMTLTTNGKRQDQIFFLPKHGES